MLDKLPQFTHTEESMFFLYSITCFQDAPSPELTLHAKYFKCNIIFVLILLFIYVRSLLHKLHTKKYNRNLVIPFDITFSGTVTLNYSQKFCARHVQRMIQYSDDMI